ncbi:MAG TPA: hypothetical protein VMD99_05505 [Terriglobales bacterium]|nr:hypothetical protein [Terriglobales bacterium]
MKRYWLPSLLLLVASLLLACGSGGGRQLQSITINATPSGNQIQLVAIGTFSSPPSTVTPLPVFWSIDLPPAQYTLTAQPLLIDCTVGEYLGPFIAMAPADPNAPSSGQISTTKMVTQSTSCTQVNH